MTLYQFNQLDEMEQAEAVWPGKEDDFNIRMFEILTDKSVKYSLQSIVNSL